MALADILTINISTSAPAVSKPGFGIPLILSCHTLFADLVRFYTSTAGMVTDGFSTSGPEYKAASAAFAQNPRPAQIAIGKRTHKPTQSFTVTPTAVNNKVYTVTVNGTDASYTSDGTATVAEITAGLKTAIDALSLAITVTDNSTNFTIVANSAGAWFSVQVNDITLLDIKQLHADGGCAADLDAILLFDNTWYAIINPWNSDAEAKAIAAWTESNQKLFICASINTDIPGSGSSDLASSLVTSAYARSPAFYHAVMAEFLDAAMAGRCLPLVPGSETWAFKTLAGISAGKYTPTQIAHFKTKKCNWYETVAGVNVTEFGTTPDGEYIDVIRFRDWQAADMAAAIFTLLASVNKVPFTDDGGTSVEGVIRASLQRGEDAGGLAKNPKFDVTVPLVANVSTGDRTARQLNPITFTAKLAGAVHGGTINGVVSV